MKHNLAVVVEVFLLVIFAGTYSHSQTNPNFNVDLLLDYSSVEQSIALYEDQPVNTHALAELRGNRIAVSTTGLIENGGALDDQLTSYLDSLKYHQTIKNDIYHLEDSRKDVGQIKKLLAEIKKRNFNRRIIATIEQIFPQDAAVTITIPVYFVSLGHENVDAYVRRIIWHGNIPQFVGDDEGELTIVVNLAKAVNYAPEPEECFISLLGVVAHEVFHATFGAYKDNSTAWKKYYRKHKRPFDVLLDLTQNEGIAYYLSLDQRGRGYLPRDWYNRTRDVFKTFNTNASELLSPSTSPNRISKLIRTANLSGYWESYGSMVGMFIAREIDLRLGRASLIETLSLGPLNFFRKYVELIKEDSNLPKLRLKITAEILRE